MASITVYDVVRTAAAQLGIRFSTEGNTGTSPVTCPDLQTFTTDDQRFRFSFMARDTGTDYPEYRLVTATDVSAASGNVIVQSAFATFPDDADFFLILSPDEWITALDDYVQTLYYLDWVTITLVAGQSEYNIVSDASWLTLKQQIISFRYRNTATSGDPIEASVPTVFIREDKTGAPTDATDVLNLQLTGGLPSDVSNTNLQVQARHYHAGVDSFADNLNFPQRLVVAGAKWAALKLIYNKLGPQAKRNFGQAMVLAERDVTEQEQRFQNHTIYKDWQSEDAEAVGNVDGQISWGW